MDRNLEKNLRKVQGFRAKGQLDKALKQLQDWARKNPDTPHYQYEAAMVAFDLGDFPVGLNWLKGLLRAAPDTKDRILQACTERYTASPALPLAEFLVERYLAESRVREALETVEHLEEADRDIYAKKTLVKHRSIATTPSTPAELIRKSFYTQIAIARAAQKPTALAEHIETFLDAAPEEAGNLVEICAEQVDQHPRDASLLKAHGRALCADGKIRQGCELLLRAGARDNELAPVALEQIEALKPEDDDRGTWLRCTGELALITGDGERATDCFRNAADADPSCRQALLERLATVPDSLPKEALAQVLKLRLRLMVVMRQLSGVPALAERLRKEEMADPDELRLLMGEGKAPDDGRPSELLVILSETALRSGDLRAAAVHAGEIPDTDEHSLHKVIRTIESLSAEWDESQALELAALQVVLYARVGEQNGANGALVQLWENPPENTDSLFAITNSCLPKIHPTPALLLTMLPTAFEHGQMALAADALDGVLRHSPDDVKWLVDDLVNYLDENPDSAAALLELLDGCDKDLGGAQQLRYPVAAAALACGQVERAVPEFQILLMARSQLSSAVLDRMREALKKSPEDVSLNLAAYDLLLEEESLEDAGKCLARVLTAEPQRIEEFSKRFDQLLQKAPQSARLWMDYAEALFQVGRYAQLNQLCDRAATNLAADETADFRLLQARIMVEDGRVREAVESLDGLMSAGHVSVDKAIEAVREMVATDPTNARAQYLLGTACGQKGLMSEAIAALSNAAKSDRTLVNEISGKLEELAGSPAATAEHLVDVASYHRRHGDRKGAARSYERGLRLERELADRVLGELTLELEDPHGDLALTFVGARAARMGGRVELACDLLTRIYSRQTDQFTTVLAELRKISEENPGELLPPRTMARVMLAHKSPDAAAEIIGVVGENESYPLESRIETLREFHARLPEQPGLSMTLAHLLGTTGEIEEATSLLWESLRGDDLDVTAALVACGDLLEQCPGHGELRLIQHDLLLRRGDVEAALASLPEPDALRDEQQPELTTRLLAHPRRAAADPVLAGRLADGLRRQNQHDEAIDTLRRAAASLDGEAQLRMQAELARSLERAQRNDEARDVLAQMVGEGLEWNQIYTMVKGWEDDRIERESEALRARIDRDPTDHEARFDLAERLLARDHDEEAVALLTTEAPTGEPMIRRACLLAECHTRNHHAARAEGVLRASESIVDGDRRWRDELRFRLAVCAEALGRHADAYARYQDLIESPHFGERARERAGTCYGRHLSEAAGEYRAVICRTSTL